MKIYYDRNAVKHIKSLNSPAKERVIEAILRLPKGDVVKMQGTKNRYRLRVGSLRVIYNKYDDEIVIAACLPRGEAYKRG